MQQTITWTDVDPDLCRHIESPGYNVLISFIDMHHNNIGFSFVSLPYFNVRRVVVPEFKSEFKLTKAMISPSRESYGVSFVMILEIVNRVITAPHCKMWVHWSRICTV